MRNEFGVTIFRWSLIKAPRVCTNFGRIDVLLFINNVFTCYQLVNPTHSLQFKKKNEIYLYS